MKKFIHTPHTKQKGFTLLFAVLVSTLVISISATITSIAMRQTILSGTSRESQYAYYAASTALECAHYWDKRGVMDQNKPSQVVFPIPGENDGSSRINSENAEYANITCSGFDIIGGNASEGIDEWETAPDTTTFYLKITDTVDIKDSEGNLLFPQSYCAEATVTKTELDEDGLSTVTIEAKGYNTCDENNPRRVERGLIQQYQS